MVIARYEAAGASPRPVKAFYKAMSASVFGRLGRGIGLNFTNFRWPFAEDRAFGVLSLLVLTVPLAFSLKTYENFETVKFCLFLILLGWALWEFFKSKSNSREAGVFLPRTTLFLFGLFLSAGLLSVLSSPDRFTGFFGVYTRYTSGFLFYFGLSIFIFLLTAVAQREKYIFLLKILVFDSLLIAIYGLLESAGIGLYSGIDILSFSRSPSFLGNPNFSSFFLAVVLPLSLVFLGGAKNFLGKVYYGLCAFFIIWALVMFSSRGALLGGLAGLVILGAMSLWHRINRKYLATAIFALGLVMTFVFGFMSFVRPNLAASTLKFNDSNISLRLYVWDIAFKAIGEHPFLGVGPGNFLEYYELNRGKHLADQLESFDDPHNLFLFQAATGGLVFALAFAGLLLSALWHFLRSFRALGDPLAAALSASLVAWTIAASFNPVSVPVFLLLGVLLSGYVLSLNRPVSLAVTTGKIRAGKWLGIALLIFGTVFLLAEHLFNIGYQAYYFKQFEKVKKFTSLAWNVCPCNQFYKLYNLGSRIKLDGHALEANQDIVVWESGPSIRWRLRAANLRMLAFLETKNPIFADQSIRDMKEVIATNPNHAERFVKLAFYDFEAGRFEDAIDSVDQGLSLNMRLFPAWMLKAKLHQNLNQKQLMISSLKRVEEEFPNDVYLKRLIAEAVKIENIKSLPIIINANYGRLE